MVLSVESIGTIFNLSLISKEFSSAKSVEKLNILYAKTKEIDYRLNSKEDSNTEGCSGGGCSMRSSLWLWWCATTWMKVKHRGHSQGRKGPREVIGRSINADELHQLRRDQTFQRLKHMAGHLAESARFASVQNHNWKIGFFVNSFSEHTALAFFDKNKRLFWNFLVHFETHGRKRKINLRIEHNWKMGFFVNSFSGDILFRTHNQVWSKYFSPFEKTARKTNDDFLNIYGYW